MFERFALDRDPQTLTRNDSFPFLPTLLFCCKVMSEDIPDKTKTSLDCFQLIFHFISSLPLSYNVFSQIDYQKLSRDLNRWLNTSAWFCPLERAVHFVYLKQMENKYGVLINTKSWCIMHHNCFLLVSPVVSEGLLISCAMFWELHNHKHCKYWVARHLVLC